jgi:hypothetical protein
MAQCEMGTLCVQVRRRTVWAMRASGFNVHRAQGGPGVGNSASGFMVGPPLPRGYLTFGDIEGKLDVLRVECTKCDRKGRYHVHKLIERYGRNDNMMKWREMLDADCPKRDARMHDRSDLVCPEGLIARGSQAAVEWIGKFHRL